MPEIEHAFKPGMAVAVYSSRWPSVIRRDIVAKIHKTGRFALQGHIGQFSALGDGTKASCPTSDRWARTMCEVWSEEHDRLLAASERRRKWDTRLGQVMEQSRANDFTPSVAQLEALTALMQAFDPVDATPCGEP